MFNTNSDSNLSMLIVCGYGGWHVCSIDVANSETFTAVEDAVRDSVSLKAVRYLC